MGKIVVIDGLDGSGKGTQTNMLYNWLKDNLYNAHKIRFPEYNSPSSSAVKMYLNGELGNNASELNPYMCSTFYAVDRVIQYIKDFKEIYEQDSIIVSDRYISANIIHQGGKIKDVKLRNEFFKWAYEFETKLLGIPKEDITIILEVPVWKSQELITKRYHGDENKKDIHEDNTGYLQMCYESSNSAVEYLNKLGYKWEKINCINELEGKGELKTREDIFGEVLEKVMSII